MILETAGKICDGLFSVGHSLFPAYLLTSPEPVLFEGGITVLGPTYGKDLENHLGDASRLSLNLITHAHYDHCGAVPYLKRRIASLRTGASGEAGEILRDEDSVAEMRRMNEVYETRFPHLMKGEDVSFRGLDPDMTLRDGDRLDLGKGWSVDVIATPGHTKDSLSFYIPGIRALVPGEAVGLYTTGLFIQSEFSSSYEAYMESLGRLSRLDVRILLMAHLYVLTGEDASEYLGKSLTSAKRFKTRIEVLLQRFHGDRARVVEEIFRTDYVEDKAVQQDRLPYLANLQSKVEAVAEGK